MGKPGRPEGEKIPPGFLREQRLYLGLDQAAMGSKLGMSAERLRKLEAGDYGGMSLDALVKFAELLKKNGVPELRQTMAEYAAAHPSREPKVEFTGKKEHLEAPAESAASAGGESGSGKPRRGRASAKESAAARRRARRKRDRKSQ